MLEPFLCRFSGFDLTECIKDSVHSLFAFKHVPHPQGPISKPIAENAAKQSCERNKITDLASPFNTVFFGEQKWQSKSSIMCWAFYNNVFQCKGVPGVGKECPDNIMECRSCKRSHPRATGFRIEVGRTDGHLDHKLDVYKIENGGLIKLAGGFDAC